MMRSSDTAFALNAAQALAGEMQLASLAVQKAGDSGLKGFAQRINTQDQAIREDLKATTLKTQFTVPDNATEQELSQHAKLLKCSGLKFDAAFADDIATDSRENLASFRKEANKGKNPELRAFAARALPILEGQLDTAKGLHTK